MSVPSIPQTYVIHPELQNLLIQSLVAYPRFWRLFVAKQSEDIAANAPMPQHESGNSSVDGTAPTLRSAHLDLSRENPSTPAITTPSVSDGRSSDSDFFPSLAACNTVKKQSPGERLQRR